MERPSVGLAPVEGGDLFTQSVSAEEGEPQQHPRLSCIFCDPNEFQRDSYEYMSLKNDSMPRGEE